MKYLENPFQEYPDFPPFWRKKGTAKGITLKTHVQTYFSPEFHTEPAAHGLN